MAVALHIAGHTDYQAVHDLQEALVDLRARGLVPDVILLLEHAATITVGRARGAADNVLDPSLPVVPISRGGDVTLHAPGQLVAYPIVGLAGPRRDVMRHLRALEDAVITLLTALGLAPCRDDRNTGVWLASPHGAPQKVCAVGIAVRRWVTWHGLALNVDLDLSLYSRIHPCGFGSDTVTSLAQHLHPPPGVAELLPHLGAMLCSSLNLPMHGPMLTAQTPDLHTVRALLDGSVGGVTLRARRE